MDDQLDQQQERALRAAFEGVTVISVYGATSTTVMQWGIERGYVERLGGSTLYRLTVTGRKAMVARESNESKESRRD